MKKTDKKQGIIRKKALWFLIGRNWKSWFFSGTSKWLQLSLLFIIGYSVRLGGWQLNLRCIIVEMHHFTVSFHWTTYVFYLNKLFQYEGSKFMQYFINNNASERFVKTSYLIWNLILQWLNPVSSFCCSFSSAVLFTLIIPNLFFYIIFMWTYILNVFIALGPAVVFLISWQVLSQFFKGNAQFVQKVTFKPLMDLNQNHYRSWTFYKSCYF